MSLRGVDFHNIPIVNVLLVKGLVRCTDTDPQLLNSTQTFIKIKSHCLPRVKCLNANTLRRLSLVTYDKMLPFSDESNSDL